LEGWPGILRERERAEFRVEAGKCSRCEYNK
jgi:hypothetical protein